MISGQTRTKVPIKVAKVYATKIYVLKIISGFFFQLGWGMELQEKKHKKRLQDTENPKS